MPEYELALMGDPASFEIRSELAGILAEMGRRDEAWERLAEAPGSDPGVKPR